METKKIEIPKTKILEKFMAYSSDVRVSGKWILAYVEAVPASKEYYLGFLKKNNIVDPKADKWYPQQDFLNSLNDIPPVTRTSAFPLIGKKIPKISQFPTQQSVKQAFSALDGFYKANHQGLAGSYRLVSYDEKSKQSILECNTPYPKSLTTGILICLWQEYRSDDQIRQPKIEFEGDGLVTFTISW